MNQIHRPRPRPPLGVRFADTRAAAAVLALVVLAPASRAEAAPNCMARVLADVPAEEAPEQVKSKESAVFGPVTQIKVEKATGKMFYCAKNSYCYGSNAFEITTPCRIKLDKTFNFGRYFMYFTR